MLAGIRGHTLAAFATHTERKVKLAGTVGPPAASCRYLGTLNVMEDGVVALPLSTFTAALRAHGLGAKIPKTTAARWPLAVGTYDVHARHAGKLSFEIRFAPSSRAEALLVHDVPDFDVG